MMKGYAGWLFYLSAAEVKPGRGGGREEREKRGGREEEERREENTALCCWLAEAGYLLAGLFCLWTAGLSRG